MSISDSRKYPAEEIIKERPIAKTSLRKIKEISSLFQSDGILGFITVFLVMITGIGELFKVKFSLSWWILVLVIIILFALEKIYIIKSQNKEVISQAEPPNLLKK